MDNINRKCLYINKGGTHRGIIINQYEEVGGKDDGQIFIIVKDSKTKKSNHVPIECILEILD